MKMRFANDIAFTATAIACSFCRKDLVVRLGRKRIRCNRYDRVYSAISEAGAIGGEGKRADTSSGITKLLVIKQLQGPIRNSPKLNLTGSCHGQVATIDRKGQSLVLI